MTDLIKDWNLRKSESKSRHSKFLDRLRKYRGKKLDNLGNEIHEEVFSEINCLDCANCCTSIPPMVNKADVSRISKKLGMKVRDFHREHTRLNEDGDLVLNTVPCTFLGEDNLCFIYEFRPRACREYPHTDSSEFSQHLKLHKLNSQYCPAVFNILERMMSRI